VDQNTKNFSYFFKKEKTRQPKLNNDPYRDNEFYFYTKTEEVKNEIVVNRSRRKK
jgi:hypothetical protein